MAGEAVGTGARVEERLERGVGTGRNWRRLKLTNTGQSKQTSLPVEINEAGTLASFVIARSRAWRGDEAIQSLDRAQGREFVERLEFQMDGRVAALLAMTKWMGPSSKA